MEFAFRENDIRVLLTNYISILGVQDVLIDYIILRVIKHYDKYMYNFPLCISLGKKNNRLTENDGI